MTRLLILVEGDSEELFVKKVLSPHLARFGVYAVATGVVSVTGVQWLVGIHEQKPDQFRR